MTTQIFLEHAHLLFQLTCWFSELYIYFATTFFYSWWLRDDEFYSRFTYTELALFLVVGFKLSCFGQ